MSLDNVIPLRESVIDPNRLSGIAPDPTTTAFTPTQARPNCVPSVMLRASHDVSSTENNKVSFVVSQNALDENPNDFPPSGDLTDALNSVEMSLKRKLELSSVKRDAEDRRQRLYALREQVAISSDKDSAQLLDTVRNVLGGMQIELKQTRNEIKSYMLLTYLNQEQDSYIQSLNKLPDQAAELSVSSEARFFARTIDSLLTQAKEHLTRLRELTIQATTTRSISTQNLRVIQAEVNLRLEDLDAMSTEAAKRCQGIPSLKSWWSSDAEFKEKRFDTYGLGLKKFSLLGPKGPTKSAEKFFFDSKAIYIPSGKLFFCLNNYASFHYFIPVLDKTGTLYIKIEPGLAFKKIGVLESDVAQYYLVGNIKRFNPSWKSCLVDGITVEISVCDDSGTLYFPKGDGVMTIEHQNPRVHPTNHKRNKSDVSEWTFKATDKPLASIDAALARINSLALSLSQSFSFLAPGSEREIH